MFNLDLNLLRVFDILMEVRSVTRAADRLGLTQSAVSHALGRLREQLNDPLFVRSRNGLRPTQRANEIATAVREGLTLLRDAISEQEFDPAISNHSFTISASSYFCATLLPLVIRRARRDAPHIRLHILPTAFDLITEFEAGTLDLALGAFLGFPAGLSKTALFSDELVWIGRIGSDSADVASRPRLNVARPFLSSPFEGGTGRERIDPRITIVTAATTWDDAGPVSTYDALTAGALIADSDLVALWPRQLAALLTASSGVTILGPADQDPFETSMLWPSRFASDKAHSWLRRQISDAASELAEQSRPGSP